MLKRKRKKVSKYRGTRTHGRGDPKKGRGKGNRGGVGRAGMTKHKWTYRTKYEKDQIRKKGFKRWFEEDEYPVINLYHIENLALSGKLENKDGKYYFEFDGKVLGAGRLTVPVVVRAPRITDKAVEKIRAVGGDVEIMGMDSGVGSSQEPVSPSGSEDAESPSKEGE